MKSPPAYRGSEPYVFVSYAHDDSALVLPEIRRLNGLGYRVYYDDHIQGGSRWQDELAHAIESAAAFLLFVTPRSIESTHCQRELAFAVSEDVPLLAVHLVETELPAGTRLAMGNRQAIFRHRLDDQTYVERLEEALAVHIARVAESSPPTARKTHAWWLIPTAAVLVMAGYLILRGQPNPADYSARLDSAHQAIDQDLYGLAYTLLREPVEAGTPDPELRDLWSQIINPMIPLIGEPGASVSSSPMQNSIATGFSPASHR